MCSWRAPFDSTRGSRCSQNSSSDGATEAPFLRRIKAADYPHVRAQAGGLDRNHYIANFRGAITLAAYEPATFAGQVSGVALDALMSGSPIVASEGTEPAELVREFGVGVVVRFGEADSLDAAVTMIISRWHHYSPLAREAAAILARRHDPLRLALHQSACC